MVGQNHSKYHGVGICLLQYTMEYCTILILYVGKRFESDCSNNLYYIEDMLCIYYSYPW